MEGLFRSLVVVAGMERVRIELGKGGNVCRERGCRNKVQLGGKCKRHGGARMCEERGCNKQARGREGLCSRHGGGKRCDKKGCMKGAVGGSYFCRKHGSMD